MTDRKKMPCVMEEGSFCAEVLGIKRVAPDLIYIGLIPTRVESLGLCSLLGTWIIGECDSSRIVDSQGRNC